MNSFAQIKDESSRNGFIMVKQPQAEAPGMELGKRTTLDTLGTLAGTITTAIGGIGGDNITATGTANTSVGKSCGVSINNKL